MTKQQQESMLYLSAQRILMYIIRRPSVLKMFCYAWPSHNLYPHTGVHCSFHPISVLS